MKVFDIFCLTALGFITQVRSDVLLARDAAAKSPYYTTTYQATKTSTWVVPTLVPCPPIEWTNTHSTPVVQTTTVTKTLPGTTAYVTSEITKTVPSYATITETDTFYTWSTLTKTSVFTSWTTATSYTGEYAASFPVVSAAAEEVSAPVGRHVYNYLRLWPRKVHELWLKESCSIYGFHIVLVQLSSLSRDSNFDCSCGGLSLPAQIGNRSLNDVHE
jgi:hypothetical protein